MFLCEHWTSFIHTNNTYGWQANIQGFVRTMLFLHWLFSWQTSILVRLCYFYTGFQLADKHKQAYLWDYAIFILVFNRHTSKFVRLCYFYTGASVGRQVYMWGHSYFYTDSSTGRQAYLWLVWDSVILHWFFNCQQAYLLDYTKAVFSSTACLQLVEQCIICEDLWALYHGGCCMNQGLK